jgi:hypothetical protein
MPLFDLQRLAVGNALENGIVEFVEYAAEIEFSEDAATSRGLGRRARIGPSPYPGGDDGNYGDS